MRRTREAWVRYGLAAIATVIGLLLRSALTPIIGTGTLYITAYPTVFVVAVLLGAGPGLFSMALAVLLIELFMIEPVGQVKWSLSLIVRFGIVMAASAYVGRVAQRLRSARDGLERAVGERTAEVDRTHAELDAERQRLYDVLQALPAWVVLLTADFREVFANRAFKERFPNSCGQRCYEHLYGRSAPCADCRAQPVLNDGTPQRAEWVGPDGRNYDVYDYRFRDLDGSPLILKMGIDTTDRRLAEAELQRHRQNLEGLVAARTAEYRAASAEAQSSRRASVRMMEKAVQAQQQAEQTSVDLRMSEQRLREARELLEAVTEGAEVMIATVDRDLRYTYFNKTHQEEILRLTGVRSALGLGLTEVLERIPEREVALALWRRALAGETIVQTVAFGDPDRHRREYSVRLSPIRDAAGEVVGAGEVTADVTELARAQEALQQSEERYRTLFDNMTEGFFQAEIISDVQSRPVDFRFVDVNPAHERIVGLPRGQVLGHTAKELFPGIEPHWLETIATVVRTREPRYVEGYVADTGRYYANSYFAVGPDQFASVFSDITERKLAEDALRRAHDELDQKVRERTEELERLNRTLRMISACNEALVRAKTEADLVREVCRIICEVGGYRMAWVGYAEPDEARTVRPIAAFGVDDGFLDEARITWADEPRGRGPTGTAIRRREARICHDVGTDPALEPWREAALARGYHSAIALPVGVASHILGALTIHADVPSSFDNQQATLLVELADDLAFGIVTLRAAVERDNALALAESRAAQLRALATELGQAEQRERRRLAQILHDHLQQLLVGARLNLASVEGTLTTRMQREAISRVSAILDEATDAARVITAELSPPVLHEHGLVAGLEWLAREVRSKYGLKVRIQAGAGREPRAEGVRVFLFEAVRELLFNIVKHAGVDRARVALDCLGNDRFQVIVTDNGAGFEPKHLDSAASQLNRFGLFSVRERLSCLGGSMTVESAPGEGSRFILEVPGSAAGPESAGALTTPSGGDMLAAGSGGVGTVEHEERRKIRVLLADDHPVMRQGLALLLQGQPDIEVVAEAGDGAQALELARELKPDVVLMDVSMPGLSGVDATQEITANLPAVHVIGLSMHAEAEVAGAMLQHGAVTYLTKGGPVKDLVAAIRFGASLSNAPEAARGAVPTARPAPTRATRRNKSQTRSRRPAKPASRRRSSPRSENG